LRERYINPIRKQGKEVIYFVAVVRREQEVRLQEKEVESARWVGWEEGRGLVTFGECREMVDLVGELLDRKGEEVKSKV
jgi:bis(5'-nucleosidyl)-tetraphosphatase